MSVISSRWQAPTRNLNLVLRRGAALTLAAGAASILTALFKAALARSMTSEAFGTFSFVVALLGLFGLVFEFGIFLPAARIAAREEDTHERRAVIGAALALFVPLAAGCVLVVGASSLVVGSVMGASAARATLIGAALCFVYPFQSIGQLLAQGADSLNRYSVSVVVGPLVSVTLASAALYAGWRVAPGWAVTLQSAGYLAGGVLLVVGLRPAFSRGSERIREILRETRDYGYRTYVGRIFSVGTYNMDVVMVGAFTGAKAAGLYALAVAVTSSGGLPAQGLTTALFRRLTQARAIPRETLWAVLGCALVSFLLTLGFAGPFIRLLFSARYGVAADYVLPLALAQLAGGIAGIYTMFLQARGKGVELQRAGFALTFSNLVLNFALIPRFGAAGAAWASCIALLLNLVVRWRYCRGVQRGEQMGVPTCAA